LFGGQIFFGVWHRYRPLFFGMTEVMIARRPDMLLSIGLKLLLFLLFMMCAGGQGTKAVGKMEHEDGREDVFNLCCTLL